MNRPEDRLSHWCCEYLDRVLLTDVPTWFTAVDTGTVLYREGTEEQKRQARMNWENHRRFVGIKPYHLDLYVFQQPLFAQIELKAGHNKPSDGQRITMRLLTERGIPNGWANTLERFHEVIVRAGFRLHRNAENILSEVHQRYQAMEREAALKPREKKAPPGIDPKIGERRAREALISDADLEQMIWGTDG